MSTNIKELSIFWKEVKEKIEHLEEEKRNIKEQMKELKVTKRMIREKIKNLGGVCDYQKSYKPDERALQMISLFKQGNTLEEIGRKYGVTRERVRQILSKSGITREEGGISEKIRNRKCKVEGCTERPIGKKYCSKHYARVLLYGDPHYSKTIREHDGKCRVHNCDGRFKAKGLCNTHYHSFQRFKNLGRFKTVEEYLECKK